MEGAVAPQMDPVVQIFGTLKREAEGTFESLKQDDELWRQFGVSPYFSLVKNYVDRLVQALDELEGQAFDNGASLEEIGLRRAVNRLTKANLLSLTSKIERTTEQLNGARTKDKSTTVSR